MHIQEMNHCYSKFHFRIQECSCFNLLTQSLEANLLYFGLSKFLSFMQYLLYIIQTTVFHGQQVCGLQLSTLDVS